jgi:hypothetical protein
VCEELEARMDVTPGEAHWHLKRVYNCGEEPRVPLLDIGNHTQQHFQCRATPTSCRTDNAPASKAPIFTIVDDVIVTHPNLSRSSPVTPERSKIYGALEPESEWSPSGFSPVSDACESPPLHEVEPEPLEYAALACLHELPAGFAEKIRANVVATERELRHLRKENAQLRRQCHQYLPRTGCTNIRNSSLEKDLFIKKKHVTQRSGASETKLRPQTQIPVVVLNLFDPDETPIYHL